MRVTADGTIEVTDKRSGAVHAGLHRFEDVADKGDLYTFCPLPDEAPGRSLEPTGRVRTRVLARGPVVAELEVAVRRPAAARAALRSTSPQPRHAGLPGPDTDPPRGR